MVSFYLPGYCFACPRGMWQSLLPNNYNWHYNHHNIYTGCGLLPPRQHQTGRSMVARSLGCWLRIRASSIRLPRVSLSAPPVADLLTNTGSLSTGQKASSGPARPTG